MGGTTSVDGNVVDSQVWLSYDDKNCDGLRKFSSSTGNVFFVRRKHISGENLTSRTSVNTNTEVLLRFYTRKTKVLQSQEILQRVNSSLSLFNKTTNGYINPFSGRSVKVLQQS